MSWLWRAFRLKTKHESCIRLTYTKLRSTTFLKPALSINLSNSGRNFRECQESNLGPQGEKQICYLSAMQPPTKQQLNKNPDFILTRVYLTSTKFFALPPPLFPKLLWRENKTLSPLSFLIGTSMTGKNQKYHNCRKKAGTWMKWH